MNNRLTAAFFTVILILGCSISDKKTETFDFSTVLPDSLNRFVRTDKVKIYPADSLYNYINGAAEEYISCGAKYIPPIPYTIISMALRKNTLAVGLSKWQVVNIL